MRFVHGRPEVRWVGSGPGTRRSRAMVRFSDSDFVCGADVRDPNAIRFFGPAIGVQWPMSYRAPIERPPRDTLKGGATPPSPAETPTRWNLGQHLAKLGPRWPMLGKFSPVSAPTPKRPNLAKVAQMLANIGHVFPTRPMLARLSLPHAGAVSGVRPLPRPISAGSSNNCRDVGWRRFLDRPPARAMG